MVTEVIIDVVDAEAVITRAMFGVAVVHGVIIVTYGIVVNGAVVSVGILSILLCGATETGAWQMCPQPLGLFIV